MRKNNFKKITVISLIFSILCLSFAFAAFSTSLNINGTASVSSNWDIVWDNMQEVEASGYAEAGSLSITDNDTNVVGSVGTLNAPGDKLIAKWDVHNKGDINAQTIKINKPNLSCAPTSTNGATKVEASQVCNDLTLTINVEDWGDITTGTDNYALDAGVSKLVTLTLEYSSSVTTPLSGKVEVSIKEMPMFEFEQTDSSSSSGGGLTEDVDKVIKVISGKGYNIGDEVAIGDENFMVASSTTKTITILAKYNLLVGDIYKKVDNATEEFVEKISETDKGYNLQSSEAVGWIKGANIGTYYIGTIKFSETKYWLDENENLLPAYGNETDESFYFYDSNSSTYIYVDNYKKILEKEYNLKINEARLINEEEYENLYDEIGSVTREYLLNTSYWMGWSCTKSGIGNVNRLYLTVYTFKQRQSRYGVRPVLTISRDYLEEKTTN